MVAASHQLQLAVHMGRIREFERVMLPHLEAAYGLARWILRHPHDAEDAVQEALLKAYRSFDNYAGGSAQAWLLAIVRNTCLTALSRRKREGKVVALHDTLDDRVLTLPDPAPLADARLVAEEERRRVHAALFALPTQFREVLVLREFNDLGYREIAGIVGAPVGTVMSRLSRARERLHALLASPGRETDKERSS